MKGLLVLILFTSFVTYPNSLLDGYIKSKNGRVEFISNAPLEIIQASSEELTGIINTTEKTFAFKIPIQSFEGFNSPLQQTHFFENYLEVESFSVATYSGKIIESIDLKQDGNFQLRAKGKLEIHGVAKERIIKINWQKKGDQLKVTSSFSVPLDDHDILIPSIVSQKIMDEIQVNVQVEF